MKLKGKIFIDGRIEALTGLSIGGSKSDIMIGEIDNSVIKTSDGVPYIPGSSLKGKIRSLYELSRGKNLCDCSKQGCEVCTIFGLGANKRTADIGPTRVIIRDAYLDENSRQQMLNKEGIFRDLELIYTEGKWENSINRRTGRATNPRQTERVPAGAKFVFNIVFNVFEDTDIYMFYQFLSAMSMVEDDYIGGSGSRGYGRVKFVDFDVRVKSVKDYEEGNVSLILEEGISDISSLTKDEDIKEKLTTHLGVD